VDVLAAGDPRAAQQLDLARAAQEIDRLGLRLGPREVSALDQHSGPQLLRQRLADDRRVVHAGDPRAGHELQLTGVGVSTVTCGASAATAWPNRLSTNRTSPRDGWITGFPHHRRRGQRQRLRDALRRGARADHTDLHRPDLDVGQQELELFAIRTSLSASVSITAVVFCTVSAVTTPTGRQPSALTRGRRRSAPRRPTDRARRRSAHRAPGRRRETDARSGGRS